MGFPIASDFSGFITDMLLRTDALHQAKDLLQTDDCSHMPELLDAHALAEQYVAEYLKLTDFNFFRPE